MNRYSDVSMWDDLVFVDYMLSTDAREKGVKVLSTTIDREANNISCVVEYLRAGI